MQVPDQVEAIAALAQRYELRIGVAESLTCGQVSAALGAGDSASSWFAGGIVAYASSVKFAVLGVTPGPVVTALCAREMALGAARVLGADVAVATTGVGGPDPEEGRPPGTVYVASVVHGVEDGVLLELAGDPDQVLAQTVWHALDLMRSAMLAAGPATAQPR
jgi:nicotinamide-nucleotide amidase